MMLLIEVAQRDGIDQHLVQHPDAIQTGVFVETNAHAHDGIETLDFLSDLSVMRLRAGYRRCGSQCLAVNWFSTHGRQMR